MGANIQKQYQFTTLYCNYDALVFDFPEGVLELSDEEAQAADVLYMHVVEGDHMLVDIDEVSFHDRETAIRYLENYLAIYKEYTYCDYMDYDVKHVEPERLPPDRWPVPDRWLVMTDIQHEVTDLAMIALVEKDLLII